MLPPRAGRDGTCPRWRQPLALTRGYHDAQMDGWNSWARQADSGSSGNIPVVIMSIVSDFARGGVALGAAASCKSRYPVRSCTKTPVGSGYFPSRKDRPSRSLGRRTIKRRWSDRCQSAGLANRCVASIRGQEE